ncbi:MAG: hypothetical protein JNL11_11175 [Bdellovibrionaceae bacterium]|nr:hypothetical protein [Pseudobdellovibrionaceae bacterium]
MCISFYRSDARNNFISSTELWGEALAKKNSFLKKKRINRQLKMLNETKNSDLTESEIRELAEQAYRVATSDWKSFFNINDPLAAQKWVESYVFQEEFLGYVLQKPKSDDGFIGFVNRWKIINSLKSVSSRTLEYIDLKLGKQIPPKNVLEEVKDSGYSTKEVDIRGLYEASRQKQRDRVFKSLRIAYFVFFAVSAPTGIHNRFLEAEDRINTARVEALNESLENLNQGIDKLDALIERKGFYKKEEPQKNR